jgi:hypothetical protein
LQVTSVSSWEAIGREKIKSMGGTLTAFSISLFFSFFFSLELIGV